MPIYMDRHDVSETVTAEHVAEIHNADLKIQHKFNCRGLTYWFDDERKTAFCLIEAPDMQHIVDMHSRAHGDIPHMIIEVEGSIVESFLGRIEDPEKSKNTQLNIINDPAFRTIMIIKIDFDLSDNNKSSTSRFQEEAIEVILKNNGRVVKQDKNKILISFDSVTNAVLSAHLISENKNYNIRISLNSGVPVTNTNSIFEDTIKLAEDLCLTTGEKVVISSNVYNLFMGENANKSDISNYMTVISESNENFIVDFMNFVELEWQNTDLKVDKFSSQLGISKSQLYRKMIIIFGVSPNAFLKNYRLSRAKDLLYKQIKNVSEIAFDTGFSSPSYFSKCFLKKYGIKPSNFFE